MAITPEQQKTAKTWQTMVDSNKALLLRKTGHDVGYWAEQARSAGMRNDAELRHWMRDEHGVTGYAQYAVSWELFGYPEAHDGSSPRSPGPPTPPWTSRCAWTHSASTQPPEGAWKP